MQGKGLGAFLDKPMERQMARRRRIIAMKAPGLAAVKTMHSQGVSGLIPMSNGVLFLECYQTTCCYDAELHGSLLRNDSVK
jgi:hypothetical protein